MSEWYSTFGSQELSLCSVAFAASIAAMPLLRISTNLVLAVELAILALANFVFVRWFGINKFTATTTLLALRPACGGSAGNHLPCNAFSAIRLTDYMISAIGVLAIAYPVLQHLLRDQWSSKCRKLTPDISRAARTLASVKNSSNSSAVTISRNRRAAGLRLGTSSSALISSANQSSNRSRREAAAVVERRFEPQPLP